MGKFNLQLTFLASPLFSSPTTRYRESGIRQPQHHPHLNGHHLTSHSLNLFLSLIINKPPHPSTCRRLEAANFSHQIKIQQLLSIPTKLRGGSYPPKSSKLLDWRILSIWEEPGKFFGSSWNNKFEVASNHSPKGSYFFLGTILLSPFLLKHLSPLLQNLFQKLPPLPILRS